MAVLGILVIGVSSCARSPAIPALTPQEAKAAQRTASERENVPVEVTNSLGMKLALIPAGQFVMGSPKQEPGRRDVESQHIVRLTRSFYMATTEVTQAEWKALMEDNPSFVEGDDHPVETIPWKDAVEFCSRLTEKEGVRYRLPTEAEWEYACRAGTTTAFHFGLTISTDDANYDGQKTYRDGKKGVFRDETTKVGSFPSNAWGLHDMHGNVWEWCSDWYGEYANGEAADPSGPGTGKTRVVRGGCWVNAPAVCRSANRGDTEPQSWNFHFGFRVVRELR